MAHQAAKHPARAIAYPVVVTGRGTCSPLQLRDRVQVVIFAY
ncbi:hypothetical protein ACFZDK_18980 [Streptomyces sp. NPDC007901]